MNALILKFISQYDSSHRIGIESKPSTYVDDDSTTNYTNANLLIECWDAIARSVSLNDYGHLTLSTQHIVYFTPGTIDTTNTNNTNTNTNTNNILLNSEFC